MEFGIQSQHISLLKNQVDLRTTQFSDRGSRLLVIQQGDSDALAVKLAERLTNKEPGLEAYRNRPPMITDLQLIDEQGAALPFTTLTVYPHAVYVETRLGLFTLTFQDVDTLHFGLPSHTKVGLRFRVNNQLVHRNAQGGDIVAVHDFVYAATSDLWRNEVVSESSGYRVTCVMEGEAEAAIALRIAPNDPHRSAVLPASEAVRASERRWHEWFEAAPGVDEARRRTYLYAWWIMGHNLVSARGVIQHEAMMPAKGKYVGIWQWDAYFHALAYRHAQPQLARDQIRVMLATQQPDGMIPDAIFDEGVVIEIDHPIPAKVTKPPLAAWAAIKLHETNPDLDFLDEIYPALGALDEWWFRHSHDGIAQYHHPYSSGLDDNPLWDGGMPVESPELNTYLCLERQALSQIAGLLGKPAESAEWARRAQTLAARMKDHFYDAEMGVFWCIRGGEPIRIFTPLSLYPLMTGSLEKKIAQGLVDYLTDPGEFWTTYPIPTVAINDPHYDPVTMWRGPTWINMNYLFIDGLFRAGFPNVARDLRTRTLDLVGSQDDIYEYYHPMSGDPLPTAAPQFGWSAALFIDLAIQESLAKGNQEGGTWIP